MPWRLIFVVILMGIVLFFVGFNIENRADVSFGFHTFTQVPIFISLFVAFLAGVIVMLPFTFGFRHKRKLKNKLNQEKKTKKEKLPRTNARNSKDSAAALQVTEESVLDSETGKG
jgi:uncharacterized integral membrane protein